MSEQKVQNEQFISEPIEPERGSFDPTLMSQGLASLPGAFVWRGVRYEITECLEHHKVSSRESAKAVGELYLRRQEFLVQLHTGQLARLYVLRQPLAGTGWKSERQSDEKSKDKSGGNSGGRRKSSGKRWFLYSISSGD